MKQGKRTGISISNVVALDDNGFEDIDQFWSSTNGLVIVNSKVIGQFY